MATSTVPTVPSRAEPARPDHDPAPTATHPPFPTPTTAPTGRTGRLALNLLRLALGFEFLWAFLDKTFGFGYTTSTAKAWIHGGSPTKGFLSNVSAGPLQSFFHSIAGAPVINWIFMLGLLGIGTALLLGVAMRIAATSGAILLLMMWLASWPVAATAAGQPTGSTNPIVDEHIIAALAIIVVGAYATRSSGILGRHWSQQPLIHRHPWLR